MTETITPTRITYWYNRFERAWVITLIDAEGWDGGESIYIGNGKAAAMSVIAGLESEHSIKAERI